MFLFIDHHKNITREHVEMPKRKLDDCNYQRWSTRIRRQTVVYTPPGRDVPQFQPSKSSCYPRIDERRVPTREEVFAKPETKIRVGKDYCPSPIIVGVLKKKRTPEAERKENHDISRFLYGSFGNGFENENKYGKLPFYTYWNKYGRSDVQPCTTFEKNCFLCHGIIGSGGDEKEAEDGGCEGAGIAICGVYGCPKVYHRSCLDSYFWEGNPDEEHWVCPRHYCNSCQYLSLFNSQHCPTCPYSSCQQCLDDGFLLRVNQSRCYHKPKENEVMCQNCRTSAKYLNAPEMLMNLRILR